VDIGSSRNSGTKSKAGLESSLKLKVLDAGLRQLSTVQSQNTVCNSLRTSYDVSAILLAF